MLLRGGGCIALSWSLAGSRDPYHPSSFRPSVHFPEASLEILSLEDFLALGKE